MTREEVFDLIRKADQSGDAEAVRKLGAYLDGLPTQTETATTAPKSGFWERFQTGVGDIGYGAGQLWSHVMGEEGAEGAERALAEGWRPDIPPMDVDVPGPAEVDAQIAQREQDYQEIKPEGFDWGRTAGNVVGTLPVMAIPGGPLTTAALGGATAGALQPVTSEDYWKTKGTQTAVGGLAGLGGGAAVNTLARTVYPKAVGAVSKLASEGITPTPGQAVGGMAARAEQKLSSLPFVGDLIASGQRRGVEDLNRAVINRSLAPIGQKGSGKIGREAVGEVRDALSKAYDDVLPKATFQVDDVLAKDLALIKSMVDELPPTEARAFDRIVAGKVFSKIPTGRADGKTFKGIESELTRIAKGYRGDASFDKRELGNALQDVLMAMRRGLERSSPDVAPELKAINQAYSRFTVLRDAAGRQGSAEGVFSPAAFRAAVRGADKSVGKGSYARGAANMQDLSDEAYRVLGPKYPDSGTAGRLMAPLLTGGLGGLAYANPMAGAAAAGAIGASALPYVPVGRQAIFALLARRPDLFKPMANAIRGLAPAAGPLAPAVSQNVP